MFVSSLQEMHPRLLKWDDCVALNECVVSLDDLLGNCFTCLSGDSAATFLRYFTN